jgi:AraC family ethanolamine operon transcriptional activator
VDLVLDNQFEDLELLAAQTPAWDLDFRLTEKGGFRGRIRQVASSDLLITHARFKSCLHQHGTTPPGYRTFALPTAGCQGFWWLGFQVDSRCIMRFGDDSELTSVSQGDFSVYTVSLSDDLLQHLSGSLGVSCPATDRAVTRVPERQMAELLALARVAVFQSDPVQRQTAAQQFTERMLIFCARGEHLPRPKPRSRDRAIQQVIRFLNDADGVQPSLPELCQIAHVSERTLQYAFRDRYGLSPNQFVRCWQLNAAHRMIRSGAGEQRPIAEIAAECGFLDPSVFAKHYRQLHGELPSTTIARTGRKARTSTGSSARRL